MADDLKKFRVKVGSHAEEVGKDENNQPIIKIYGPGDVVSTKSDLVKKFGASKFERVDGGSDIPNLGNMNMTELQSVASDLEIDYNGLKKAELIERIKEVEPSFA